MLCMAALARSGNYYPAASPKATQTVPATFSFQRRCFALTPILLVIQFARRNSGEGYGIGIRFIPSAAPDSSRAQTRTLEARRKVIARIALPLHPAPHDKMLPQPNVVRSL